MACRLFVQGCSKISKKLPDTFCSATTIIALPHKYVRYEDICPRAGWVSRGPGSSSSPSFHRSDLSPNIGALSSNIDEPRTGTPHIVLRIQTNRIRDHRAGLPLDVPENEAVPGGLVYVLFGATHFQIGVPHYRDKSRVVRHQRGACYKS